jgi:hypothetical protein
MSGGKDAKANFVWKCSNCKRESSASIVGGFQKYSADKNGQLAPLLTAECRGLEFVGFDPKVFRAAEPLFSCIHSSIAGDMAMSWSRIQHRI